MGRVVSDASERKKLSPEAAGTRDGVGASSRRAGRGSSVVAHLRRRREHVRSKPTLNAVYRVGLAVFGGLVVAAGIVMIPSPGPGWLVVFAGLGILATEFHWAHRINAFREASVPPLRRVAAGPTCLDQSGGPVRYGRGGGCHLLVGGCVRGYRGWLGLGWDWLRSPVLGS